jgi:HK97 family phage major capsid protein
MLVRAKKAYDEAVKANKPAEEIVELKAEVDELQKSVDAEAAKEKAVANEVSLDELNKVITKSVEETLKKHLPDAEKKHVTEADIKKAVATALADAEKEGTEINQKNVGAIIATLVETQVKNIRKASKMQGATKDSEGRIEIPDGECKGNLPLHKKQLLNVLMGKNMNQDVSDDQRVKGEKSADSAFERAKHQGIKALVSTTGGSGDEWVPTDMSGELLRRLYLASPLAAAMMANEIEMPTNPYIMPLSTTRPTFYLAATENTGTTATTPGTAGPTLTAKKLMSQVDYSYEMDEDSIIPILGTLQRLMAEGAAAALEDAIINGDVSTVHQDTDVETVATHSARAFAGLRFRALAITELKTDIASGGISRANLLSIKKKLKKYGSDIKNLAWIVSPGTEADIMALDEVVTVDKRGPGATSLSGVLTSYFGIPLIVSEAQREDLGVGGVNAASGNTKSAIICVNLARFLLGNRRGFTVEMFRDVILQKNTIVTSFRKAFTAIETPSATITSVSVGYNY